MQAIQAPGIPHTLLVSGLYVCDPHKLVSRGIRTVTHFKLEGIVVESELFLGC